MSKKQAHLEMIQGIVNRLSQNSFLLKGWSVVLVSALFALAAHNTNPAFLYLAYFPVIAFWILDGYFLWQERLFRGLYDYVRIIEESEIDYSMNVNINENEKESWIDAIFSKTIMFFHGTVLGAIVIVMIIVINQNKGGA